MANSENLPCLSLLGNWSKVVLCLIRSQQWGEAKKAQETENSFVRQRWRGADACNGYQPF